MSLYCDKCSGPRLNGSPVTIRAGEYVLAHGGTPTAERVGYWCRECLRTHEVTLEGGPKVKA